LQEKRAWLTSIDQAVPDAAAAVMQLIFDPNHYAFRSWSRGTRHKLRLRQEPCPWLPCPL